MATYTCRGDVRGDCGIRHRSEAAAERCCARDQAGVSRRYPSTFPTRAYSDRHPVCISTDEAEVAELCGGDY